mmetsp:Transcript_32623/g.28881  ORF Transcript_32623/g.28881 Transcript_32623/m.28881 type:complete len:196 (-) Transcript_32623:266-853(-)
MLRRSNSFSQNKYLAEMVTTFSTQSRFFDYDRFAKKNTTDENVGPGSYTTFSNERKIRGTLSYKRYTSIPKAEKQKGYSYYGYLLVKNRNKSKSNSRRNKIKIKAKLIEKSNINSKSAKKLRKLGDIFNLENKVSPIGRSSTLNNSKFRTTSTFKDKSRRYSGSQNKSDSKTNYKQDTLETKSSSKIKNSSKKKL